MGGDGSSVHLETGYGYLWFRVNRSEFHSLNSLINLLLYSPHHLPLSFRFISLRSRNVTPHGSGMSSCSVLYLARSNGSSSGSFSISCCFLRATSHGSTGGPPTSRLSILCSTKYPICLTPNLMRSQAELPNIRSNSSRVRFRVSGTKLPKVSIYIGGLGNPRMRLTIKPGICR
jgi:hypothetical protein